MFRVDSRAAARSCRGNRLAVVVVNEVTACKNAVNISARGRLINYDIAFFVGGNLAAEELRSGVMTDGDEHCGEILREGFTSHLVFKLEAANLPSTSMTFSTVLFSSHLICGFARARSNMILEARNSSRRCIIVTVSANLVKKVASSIAESPPPTTAMWWPLKKKPSQVAQVDTPRPVKVSSPSPPKWRGAAPVARMTERASKTSSPT